MEIENIITLQEEEIEEALLEYVNKHKSTKYKEMRNVYIINGSEEVPTLMTGIKFKAT